jgi:hypothetical protein
VKHRLIRAIVLTCAVVCTGTTASESEPDEASLSVKVFDAQTGDPIHARILVNAEQGQGGCRVDGQEPFRIGTSHCYIVPRQLTIHVPPGRVTLQLSRGLEYEPISDAFEISPGGLITKVYRLTRWIDMVERGYYSGDMHIHYPADIVPRQILAEDVNLGTCISSWVTSQDTAQDTAEVDHVRKINERHVYSINDQEIERFPIDTYDGPVYLVNLKRQIHLDSPGAFFPMNVEYQRKAREAGGVVCLHSAAFQDAAVSVALGEVDAVGVACNFFAYSHSLTRVKKYGNADDLALYGDTPWGTLRMTLGKYYRLLNCGFRLPASAGSAAGVKPNPVGHNRAYVRIAGDFSYESYFDGFKAGRSFVTNGPMLFLTVNERGPGETIALAGNGARKLRVSVKAHWNRPIESIEIIANGDVIQSFEPQGNIQHVDGSFDWNPQQGGWIAARVFGEKKLPIRFAHTSPIYIHMPDCPPDPSQDAAYFAKWIGRRIDSLDEDKNFTADWQRDAVRTQLENAKAVYQQLIRN